MTDLGSIPAARDPAHSPAVERSLVCPPDNAVEIRAAMRNSDSRPGTHSRSESRFHQESGQWFYSTREGEHGPFASREDAEADARLYSDLHAHLEHARDKPRGPAEG